MLRPLILPCTYAAALLCSACDVLPGATALREGKAKHAASEMLIDPTSAQFRNVRTYGEAVCGEVNGKNKMGAYVGYSRFVVDTRTYEALIDPQFDLNNLLSARELCSQLSSSEYSSSSSMLSACSRASEFEAEQAQQQSFDEHWAKHCEAYVEREVYRPPLPASASTDEQQLSTNLIASSSQGMAPGEPSEPALSELEPNEPAAEPSAGNELADEPTNEELDRAFPPQERQETNGLPPS